MKPYVLLSDQHYHEWSAFSQIGPDGVNSRLQYQIGELRRAAAAVRAAGGNRIVSAGDTFHIRGGVRASVLNPVLDVHQELINDGFEFFMIPGNHDIASKDAERLSSSITALEAIGCKVFNKPTVIENLVFVPWVASVDQLKITVESFAGISKTDLIIHAPVDNVIPGLPDHGLDGQYLADLGFNRVFSGHYHAHKEIVTNKVWSIGATTHQTWSDVGTKAGFLIVTEEGVQFNSSHAPQFIDIDENFDADELPFIVDGNFVRMKLTTSKVKDVEDARQTMLDLGAKGVQILAVPAEQVSARTGTQVTKSATLDESVLEYVKSAGFNQKVGLACAEILNSVRSL